MPAKQQPPPKRPAQELPEPQGAPVAKAPRAEEQKKAPAPRAEEQKKAPSGKSPPPDLEVAPSVRPGATAETGLWSRLAEHQLYEIEVLHGGGEEPCRSGVVVSGER